MASDCPLEAARRGTATDRSELEPLRAEARRDAAERRGGAALIGRDRPRGMTDPVLETALGGGRGAVVVVGTLDDMVVGYVLVHANDTEGSGRVASILELWVTPQARMVGVGEAMMAEVVAWARSAGCRELDADALPGDRDTKNFFETHGLVAREIKVSRHLDA